MKNRIIALIAALAVFLTSYTGVMLAAENDDITVNVNTNSSVNA